jgi:hypothetical protein
MNEDGTRPICLMSADGGQRASQAAAPCARGCRLNYARLVVPVRTKPLDNRVQIGGLCLTPCHFWLLPD